eukprot:gnl/TRDRNA2_/TRDRNA2_138215_c0_seq1.p2 gnl/TRDRNA2_/TRDRNA2_138215_c0~~gnl/TRDRNA2_/TRDRNA2_138215_c0_seq1.p2  ORF type:complete len:103 (-),score=14.48 gnl/TRDRNA2_/TRDRNA2_138215_c0_seq1:7-315(-)
MFSVAGAEESATKQLQNRCWARYTAAADVAIAERAGVSTAGWNSSCASQCGGLVASQCAYGFCSEILIVVGEASDRGDGISIVSAAWLASGLDSREQPDTRF